MNKKQLLTALLLSFNLINITYAEPSEQETIDYIEAKAETCGSDLSDADDLVESYKRKGKLIGYIDSDTKLKIQGKSMVVKEDKLYNINKIMHKYTDSDKMYHGRNDLGNLMQYYNKQLYNSRALLENLDPNISVKGKVLTVKCSANNCFSNKKQELIVLHKPYSVFQKKLESFDEIEWESEKSNHQNYTFCSAETTKKIAKSLSYLIKLNGGKAELF